MDGTVCVDGDDEDWLIRAPPEWSSALSAAGLTPNVRQIRLFCHTFLRSPPRSEPTKAESRRRPTKPKASRRRATEDIEV
jgi:hypothetical protein